jgi:opacity protein-like surface antigen
MNSSIQLLRGRLIITLLAVAIASLLATSSATAGDFDRRGWYVGFNGAYAINLFSSQLPLPAGVTLGDSGGLNAKVGYRVASWFSVEAQYEWMDGITLDFAGVPVGTFKPHVLTGNLKFHVPVWRTQPYLLLGAGMGHWTFSAVAPLTFGSASFTGFSGRVGVGMDIYLTKHWALNTELAGVLNASDFSNLTTIGGTFYYFSVSGGIMYRF